MVHNIACHTEKVLRHHPRLRKAFYIIKTLHCDQLSLLRLQSCEYSWAVQPPTAAGSIKGIREKFKRLKRIGTGPGDVRLPMPCQHLLLIPLLLLGTQLGVDAGAPRDPKADHDLMPGDRSVVV